MKPVGPHVDTALQASTASKYSKHSEPAQQASAARKQASQQAISHKEGAGGRGRSPSYVYIYIYNIYIYRQLVRGEMRAFRRHL